MSKLKSITPFLLLSLALHLVVAWYFYNKKLPARVKEKQTKAIKSYLVIAPTKQPEPEKPKLEEPVKADAIERKPELSSVTEVIDVSEAQANKKTPKGQTNKQPTESLVKQPEPKLQEPVTELSTAAPIPKTQRFSAAAAAQNYLNQLQNNEIDKLSGQSLSEFRRVKPLNDGFSQSSRKEVIDRMSAKFAAPNSGVKVVAETSHNEKLLSVHGNCFSVKRDENGDEKWLPSNACGYQDPFNGQLQKSLNKYVKKKPSK